MAEFKMFHFSLFIWIIQLILVIIFTKTYDRILRTRYDRDRTISAYMLIVNFTNLQSFLVVIFLRVYEQSGGFFLHNTKKKYRIWVWFCLIVVFAWIACLIHLFYKRPSGLFLILLGFVLTSILSISTIPLLLWKQKNEYERFMDKAVKLNSTSNEGNGLTVQQSHSIFQLNAYRNCLKDQKRRQKSKGCIKKGRSSDPNQVKAIHTENFYQLSKWSNEIQKVLGSEHEREYFQRLQKEIQERLQLYDLDDTERKNFTALSQMEDLVMPDWRTLHKSGVGLLDGHRV